MRANLESAVRFLKRRDVTLAGAIASVRGKPAVKRREPFPSLCMAILYQQLAGKAAESIHRRFLALFPDRRPTPRRLSKIHWSRLRACGVSRQKRSYLKDLSSKCLDGTVEIHDLGHLSDEAIVVELTRVKGIGRWTAEMFLLATMGRLDVFPADDFGIVSGMRALYKRPKANKEELSRIAEAWRPYRSVGCWYIWRWKDGARPRRRTRR